MKKAYLILPLILSFTIGGCSKANVKEIKLSTNTLSLVEGESATIGAIVYPTNASNKEITWSSENVEIATVSDDGIVNAIKAGQTIIKATSKYTPTIYSQCDVTVTSKEEDVDDQVVFKSKKMKTVVYNPGGVTMMEVFFREDKLVNIPYISLKKFYKTLLNRDLLIEETEDKVYKVTSGNNGVAIIDTKKDTLDSDDYENFITTTIYRQDGLTNVYFDGAPFIRVREVVEETPVQHKTIDFKKYGINLFGKEGDIYLPLVTASNIFTGPTMLTCFYSKNCIYFIDPNNSSYETSSVIYDNGYKESILGFYQDGKRPADEAALSYGELCFLIDTYYGLPGREYLHEKLAATRDLDKSLSELNDMTRKARELLKSTDQVDYFAGICMLGAFLYDAGHTVANAGVNTLLNADYNLRTKVSTKLNAIGFRSGDYQAASNYTYSYLISLYDASGQAGNEDGEYRIKGDTILYTFNSFLFDIDAWKAYYKNPSSGMPNDQLSAFKKMLDKYKDNPSIKNIVLDISINGGGYGDLVAYYMGVMTGDAYQYTNDTINNNYQTTYYDVDTNLDGVFDENDRKVNYKYNYAILTSAYSFSCGNMLPALAKENGIMVLGDKSGGGSCAVVDTITAEGLYVRLSCPNHMLMKDGSPTEFGIPVDYKLIVDNGNDTYDFSDMYNIDLMSEKMNEFYSA